MRHCDWSIKDGKDLYKFPYWLLQKVYSETSIVKYQGRYTRGKVVYLYISKQWTIDNIPIIVDVRIELGDPPENACCMSYQKLKQVFINNKFED
jgi:hypothetical protein